MVYHKENNNNDSGSGSKSGPKYYIVEFKRDRMDYFIDRNRLPVKSGSWVLVQAERGRDLGRIKYQISREDMENNQRKYPLEILHVATEQELEDLRENRKKEKEALRTCKELINFRGLEMKLVDVELQFDSNKITFYFTAEHRVDFRELVKDLASTYRTRIELRQIGVRDETKKLGGLGPCGLPLCCATWLKEFAPISTQYARDQNLAVNPTKLSGLCGRLFCCLDYEQKFYENAKKRFPEIGSSFSLDGKRCMVRKIDPLKETIEVSCPDDMERKIFTLKEFRDIVPMKHKPWLDKWLPRIIREGEKNEN